MTMNVTHLTNRMKNVGWRVYEALFKPARLDVYRRLLQTAVDEGYQVIDCVQWLDLIESGRLNPDEKILVMRHDIDTDPKLSLEWHRIEQELGCRASYYFRDSWADEDVMQQLARAGVHVSYHFEELATVAKKNRLSTPQSARDAFPEAKALFAQRVQQWRTRFNLPLDVVCSHGDWMNRHLKMPNHTLLQDDDLRQQLGIRSECYDDNVMKPFAAYISDTVPPHYWLRGEPFSILSQGITPFGILTHPKSWRTNVMSNARELSIRIKEAIQFKFGSGWH